MDTTQGKVWFLVWLHLLVLGLAAFSLFPFVWMITTSLKPLNEVFAFPIRWWPVRVTVESYVSVWGIQSFSRYFANSTIIGLSATLLSVTFAVLAGYGFSRFRFRGSRFLMILVLVTQMFPGIMLVIPYFSMASKVGLINTYELLIITYTSFALPFSIWMLKGFFDSLPRELDEAALIDGCSRFGALRRVLLPVALPGIAATTVFSFLLAWNEFLFALVLLTTPQMYTITLGIANNIGQMRVQWNDLMAASVIATIPTIILYGFLEKYLVSGLTAGAIKD
jgi:ABC-type glycerol-3-phosphate transport system permease component